MKDSQGIFQWDGIAGEKVSQRSMYQTPIGYYCVQSLVHLIVVLKGFTVQW